MKWDTKWQQYIIPCAVALVLQGTNIQQEGKIQQAQWDALWRDYICKIVLIAEEYEYKTKGKKMRFKFVHAQKKSAKDALGERCSVRYQEIL